MDKPNFKSSCGESIFLFFSNFGKSRKCRVSSKAFGFFNLKNIINKLINYLQTNLRT